MIIDQWLIQSSSEIIPQGADRNRCSDPKPGNIWRKNLSSTSPSNPQEIPWMTKRKEYKSQRVWRTSEQGPFSQLSKEHMSSQRHKVPHGSIPGPMHICCNYWLSIFIRLLIMKMGRSQALVTALGTHLFLLGYPTQLEYYRTCFILLYFTLPCLFLSFGILFFSSEKQKKKKGVDQRVGKVGRNWKSRRRGNYNQNTLYEKIIHFQKNVAKRILSLEPINITC